MGDYLRLARTARAPRARSVDDLVPRLPPAGGAARPPGARAAAPPQQLTVRYRFPARPAPRPLEPGRRVDLSAERGAARPAQFYAHNPFEARARRGPARDDPAADARARAVLAEVAHIQERAARALEATRRPRGGPAPDGRLKANSQCGGVLFGGPPAARRAREAPVEQLLREHYAAARH